MTAIFFLLVVLFLKQNSFGHHFQHCRLISFLNIIWQPFSSSLSVITVPYSIQKTHLFAIFFQGIGLIITNSFGRLFLVLYACMYPLFYDNNTAIPGAASVFSANRLTFVQFFYARLIWYVHYMISLPVCCFPFIINFILPPFFRHAVVCFHNKIRIAAFIYICTLYTVQYGIVYLGSWGSGRILAPSHNIREGGNHGGNGGDGDGVGGGALERGELHPPPPKMMSHQPAL